MNIRSLAMTTNTVATKMNFFRPEADKGFLLFLYAILFDTLLESLLQFHSKAIRKNIKYYTF